MKEWIVYIYFITYIISQIYQCPLLFVTKILWFPETSIFFLLNKNVLYTSGKSCIRNIKLNMSIVKDFGIEKKNKWNKICVWVCFDIMVDWISLTKRLQKYTSLICNSKTILFLEICIYITHVTHIHILYLSRAIVTRRRQSEIFIRFNIENGRIFFHFKNSY